MASSLLNKNGAQDIVVDRAAIDRALRAPTGGGFECDIEAIDFTFMQRSQINMRLYRVYAKDGSVSEVEAMTAGEAIEKSGVKSPEKVEQRFVRLPDVIDGIELETTGRFTV